MLIAEDHKERVYFWVIVGYIPEYRHSEMRRELLTVISTFSNVALEVYYSSLSSLCGVVHTPLG